MEDLMLWNRFEKCPDCQQIVTRGRTNIYDNSFKLHCNDHAEIEVIPTKKINLLF